MGIIYRDKNETVLAEYTQDNESIVDLSNTVITAIERKAFLGKKNLRRVILPGGIEEIGDWAFSKCPNLESVEIGGRFSKNIFGKGVFDGCAKLTKIIFEDSDETLPALHAMCANRLDNEHLLRADDLGSAAWYNRFDMYLISVLNRDDSDGSDDYVVCGEEDISYDGAFMVDGEMPEEGNAYLKANAKNKCFLCFSRLMSPKGMTDETKKSLYAYLRERAFGTNRPYAWLTLKEDCADDIEYYRLYLDIVNPDGSEIEKMALNLTAMQVQARGFLINEASGKKKGDVFFDELLL